MLVSYNFLDGLLGYTPGSGSSNSTLGGLNNTLDPNSTLTGDEQPDTDTVSHALYTAEMNVNISLLISEFRND